MTSECLIPFCHMYRGKNLVFVRLPRFNISKDQMSFSQFSLSRSGQEGVIWVWETKFSAFFAFVVISSPYLFSKAILCIVKFNSVLKSWKCILVRYHSRKLFHCKVKSEWSWEEKLSKSLQISNLHVSWISSVFKFKAMTFCLSQHIPFWTLF